MQAGIYENADPGMNSSGIVEERVWDSAQCGNVIASDTWFVSVVNGQAYTIKDPNIFVFHKEWRAIEI